ncbi:MAG: hypothetical protein EZS28_026475 [Streblomastix strix]|uniref:Uncharacterized protein n=1 Tax=Streblomastix strix TaxID=222440 RepID=A0A5J4V595_9EUKA|nr:MAG: hypothetical protein EZS28_026475 [Streblomastix strix]
MLADIEEHPHTSKVRIPRITAVPELRVVAAAPINQDAESQFYLQMIEQLKYLTGIQDSIMMKDSIGMLDSIVMKYLTGMQDSI